MRSASRSCRVLLAAGFFASVALTASQAFAVLKVACVGASNFSGDGSSAGHHVPDELGVALGANYMVKNLGVSGTAVLFKSDAPYWNGLPGDGPHLKPALDYAPDIAIFWFGGNDAKAQNWTAHKDEFIPNYEAFLKRFQDLPTKPKLFIFKSMVIHDVEGIPKTVLEMEVLPKIDVIAKDMNGIVVPYHDAFIGMPQLFPDGVHPNNAGTMAIGQFLAKLITDSMSSSPPADAGAGPTDAGTAVDTGSGPAADAGTPMAGSGGSTGTAGASGGGSGGASGSGGATTTPGGTGGSSAPAGSGTSGTTSGSSGSSGGCSLAASAPLESAPWLALAAAALFTIRARRRRR